MIPNSYLTQQPFSTTCHTLKPSTVREAASVILIKKRAEVLSLKDSQQYDEALKKVEQLISQNPNDPRNYQIRGEIYFQLQLYPQAIQNYETLLVLSESTENDPDAKIGLANKTKASYFFNMALCLQKIGRHREAIGQLKSAVKLDKTRAQAFEHLAQSYRQVGHLQKVYKIYDNLVSNYPRKSQYLMKVLKIASFEKDVPCLLSFIEKGLSLWKGDTGQESEEVRAKLYLMKGEALMSQSRFQTALDPLLAALSFQLDEQFFAKVCSKLSLCYDQGGELPQAAFYSNKILQKFPQNVAALNNLANIYIRQQHFQLAVDILNKAILTLLTHHSPSPSTLTLLRSHRLIALSHLGHTHEALSDLKHLLNSQPLQQEQQEKQQERPNQNYAFVKLVVQKYRSVVVQLDQVEEQQQNGEQFQQIQQQLVRSISQDLKQDEKGEGEGKGVNLERLQSRIDRLYLDIVSLKKKTLKEYEENSGKVGEKIKEICSRLEDREEEGRRVEQELAELKRDHQEVFVMVEQLQQDKRGELKGVLQGLKRGKEQGRGNYLQQMYWVFTSYLLAIRLVANQLVPQPTNLNLHQTSSLLHKFRNLFGTLSHIPHIAPLCQTITALLSFYLKQESEFIYSTLNRIITSCYSLQTDLQSALQTALVALNNSDYIPTAIQYQNITKTNKTTHRAYQWFHQKKKSMLRTILRTHPLPQSHQDSLIQDLVLEDVSAVLVFMVKNSKQIAEDKFSNVLGWAFRKTLEEGAKKREIEGLFARESSEDAMTGREGCTRCQIYIMGVSEVKRKEEKEREEEREARNKAMDELVREAMETKDLFLFNRAVSQLVFDW